MMQGLHVKSLLPFVPSGMQYDASRRFFAELGFEERWENGGCAGFKNGDAQFILQKMDNQEFAENFMVTIEVSNLEDWWNIVSKMKLE
jgi:hypothetical protein